MSFLLDTNIVSQLVVRTHNENVLGWLKTIDEDRLFISAITVRELWYGLEKRRFERSLSEDPLRLRIERLLRAFETRILPVDQNVARVWATMLAQTYKHIDDTGLAATAAVHGLVVVTRNVAHLRGRGVPLLDPFRSPPVIVSPAI